MKPLAREPRTAKDVRSEAVNLARRYAVDRAACGDPEGAAEFRDLASAIGRIKLLRLKEPCS